MLETLDLFRLEWIAAHCEKGTRLPDPVKVPRPRDATKKPERQTVSMRDFARRLMAPEGRRRRRG